MNKMECGACKYLGRRCTEDCVYAPYFPPDSIQKLGNAREVLGETTVAKLMNVLNANQLQQVIDCAHLRFNMWQFYRAAQQLVELVGNNLANFPWQNCPSYRLHHQQQQNNVGVSVYQMPHHYKQHMMFRWGESHDPAGASAAAPPTAYDVSVGQSLIRPEPQQQQQQYMMFPVGGNLMIRPEPQQQQQQQHMMFPVGGNLMIRPEPQQQQQQQQVSEAQSSAAPVASSTTEEDMFNDSATSTFRLKDN